MDIRDVVPDNLGPELQKRVCAVIADNELCINDKIKFILSVVSDVDGLRKIFRFLEEQDVLQSVSPDEFLSLASSEEKKEVMAAMLGIGNVEALERLVRGQKEDVQEAYEKWKESQNTMSRSCSTFSISTQVYSGQKPNAAGFTEASTISLPVVEDDDELEHYTKMKRFFDSLPDDITILLLSETDVGKSSLINSIVNYLKFASLEEAEEEGAEILIKTCFTHIDRQGYEIRVECDPTMTGGNGEEENEDTEDGQSSTQSPKSYRFSYGPPGLKKYIRIIDTPGVADVRGLEQERLNFDKILSYISDFSEIHAILVLLKPNESKLSLTFRYCLAELLTHLHVSAARYILFCFTNARGTSYVPGDTKATLGAFLKKLEAKRGINIPLNQNTMFCFDNESIRYLCARQCGAQFTKWEKAAFSQSWDQSVEKTFRLLKRIAALPVHSVTDTLSINNVRSVILALARPLAKIAHNQLRNVQLINDKVAELEDLLKHGKDLKDKLYLNQVHSVAKDIDYPMTICTANKCVQHKRLSPDPKAPTTVVYKTVCHDHCFLQGVEANTYPNAMLRRCVALRGNVEECIVCHCPWVFHMHIRYRLQDEIVKTHDHTVSKMIKNKKLEARTARQFITLLEGKKVQLQQEAALIAQYCVDFAAFLKKNCITAYNDVFKEYVEHHIREERDKVADGGSPELLQQFQAFRDEYEEQVVVDTTFLLYAI